MSLWEKLAERIRERGPAHFSRDPEKVFCHSETYKKLMEEYSRIVGKETKKLSLVNGYRIIENDSIPIGEFR